MNPIACTNCEEFDSMENCLCPDDEIDHVFADHKMILPIWTKNYHLIPSLSMRSVEIGLPNQLVKIRNHIIF